MSRAKVMEGSLDEYDMMSVVQTVGLGCQFTGLEFLDERGVVVGTMFVKGGQIVSASAEGMTGLDAVRRLMRTPRSRRFSVYRDKLAVELAQPMGPVGEVLMRAVDDEAEHMAEGALLFEGALARFPLAQALDALSLGRTCVGVDVFSDDARHVGAVCVKGGQVLFAIAGHVTGQAAMDALLAAREGRFVAYRTTYFGSPDTLGSVSDVVRRSEERAQRFAHDLLIDEDLSESSFTEVRPPKSGSHPVVRPLLLEDVSESEFTEVRPPKSGSHPVVRPQLLGLGLPPLSTFPLEAVREGTATSKAEPAVEPVVPAAPELREAPRATWSSSEPAPRARPRPSLMMSRARRLSTRVVCVTSPKGGAGRTTVAVNLAVALARRDRKVVLVDADANGVLCALRGEAKALPGVSDILQGLTTVDDAYLPTRLPNLRILPSGLSEPDPLHAIGWSELIDDVRATADLVIVDCPAGVYGATRAVASVATHALMVVSADPLACRAVEAHKQALCTQTGESLSLAGIVLNMLDYHARPSLHTFEELCASGLGGLLLEVPIPRSSVLMEASERRVPMVSRELTSAPAIAYCFELLAAILLERLGFAQPDSFAEPLL